MNSTRGRLQLKYERNALTTKDQPINSVKQRTSKADTCSSGQNIPRHCGYQRFIIMFTTARRLGESLS